MLGTQDYVMMNNKESSKRSVMLLYNEKREGEWRGGAGINIRNVTHAQLCLLVDMLRGGGGCYRRLTDLTSTDSSTVNHLA